jgi:hypothetical protein
MAELRIILKRDPNTGKQNIIVKLESDPDALPIEHEQLHRQIVEKLVGKGLQAEDLGDVIITRDGEAVPIQESRPQAKPSEAQQQRTRSSFVPQFTTAHLS